MMNSKKFPITNPILQILILISGLFLIIVMAWWTGTQIGKLRNIDVTLTPASTLNKATNITATSIPQSSPPLPPTWTPISTQRPTMTPRPTYVPTPQPTYIIYTVQENDTLYSLAGKYGTSVTEIQRLNGLTTIIILPGQKLKIPTP